MPDIEYAVDKHVTASTLNQPERRNAFTTPKFTGP